MALQVASLSIEVIENLRPLIPRIKQRDKSLADQLTRAASSVALNIAEGEHSDPGNRRARFFTAAGQRERNARRREGRDCMALPRRSRRHHGHRVAGTHHRDSLEANASVALAECSAQVGCAGCAHLVAAGPRLTQGMSSWLARGEDGDRFRLDSTLPSRRCIGTLVPVDIEGPIAGVADQCERVLRTLPLWFGIESSLMEYVRDTERFPTFV